MATKTMNVSLTEYWQNYVEGHIRRGRYQNASELMREALRLHEQEQINRDVATVESLFGANKTPETAADIEEIKNVVREVRKGAKGRRR